MNEQIEPGNGAAGKAWLALLVLLPFPTFGVVMMLHVLEEGGAGKIVYSACKLFVAGLPLFWLIVVDKQKPVFPRPKKEGMLAAVISGTVIFVLMLGGFQFIKPYIDVAPFKAKAAETGFDEIGAYLLIFAYIITVNSLLEEYVWRWFVFRKFETALTIDGPMRGYVAVFLAGLGFTVHHIFAISAWIPSGPLIALGSFGVFIGGTTWSWLYLRYRSIWPGYISHVFADVAILIMGWQIIFN